MKCYLEFEDLPNDTVGIKLVNPPTDHTRASSLAVMVLNLANSAKGTHMQMQDAAKAAGVSDADFFALVASSAQNMKGKSHANN